MRASHVDLGLGVGIGIDIDIGGGGTAVRAARQAIDIITVLHERHFLFRWCEWAAVCDAAGNWWLPLELSRSLLPLQE